MLTSATQRLDSVGSDLFIAKRPSRESLRDWLVDDVDDAIGRRQVGVNDGVLPAGVVHQDEPLDRRQKQDVCLLRLFTNLDSGSSQVKKDLFFFFLLCFFALLLHSV